VIYNFKLFFHFLIVFNHLNISKKIRSIGLISDIFNSEFVRPLKRSTLRENR
jgi:hypothetical protein